MNVTVTGAAGRLGRVVCETLVNAGHQVVATDVRWADLAGVSRFEPADLLQAQTPYALLRGAEAVVHLANHASDHGFDPRRVYLENLTMNIHVFQAASEMGIKKLIYASSIQAVASERYTGVNPDRPAHVPYLPLDGRLPPRAGNLYGLSKTATEQMLEYYCLVPGTMAVALRFPALMSDDWMERYRRWSSREPSATRVEQGFAYLARTDAAELVRAVLESDLEGYHVYMPASQNVPLEISIGQIIDQYYANVPLNKPRSEITSLIDNSQIEREVGWRPKK